MKDVLSFYLPYDFNPEHFDMVVAVASAESEQPSRPHSEQDIATQHTE